MDIVDIVDGGGFGGHSGHSGLNGHGVDFVLSAGGIVSLIKYV